MKKAHTSNFAAEMQAEYERLGPEEFMARARKIIREGLRNGEIVVTTEPDGTLLLAVVRPA